MEQILELKKVNKRPEIIIDDTIDDSIMFPKKLQAAREMLAKHPVPASILLGRFSQTQQEKGFCISGILKRADVETNTLSVVVIVNNHTQSSYKIHTVSERLNNIVQTYWNKTINVLIRPQINKDNQFEYELIEIK